MTSKLLSLLGYDEEDPQVVAGRKHGSFIARLIHTLAQAREDRDLKQTEVARTMGTTQSTVSNFERAGGDPKISTILRYADAIGADVRFLVTFPSSGTAKVIAQPAQAGTPSQYWTPTLKVAVR